jgi:hypothetical protein
VAIRSIQAAVPQGSLLGPVLFNIYTGDIPCLEIGNNIIISMYADVTEVAIQSGSIRLAPENSTMTSKC